MATPTPSCLPGHHTTWSAWFAAALLLACLGVGAPLLAGEYVFPADAKIIDVKRDFGAKGDGVADDTAAIQKAIAAALSGDYRNPRFITLPEGAYLVSASLFFTGFECASSSSSYLDLRFLSNT